MARDIFGEETELPPVEDVPRPTAIPPRDYSDIRNEGLPQAKSPGVPVDAQMMRDALALRQPPAPKEHVWSGTGKALASGAAELGGQVLGAGEYLSSRMLGPESPVTQGLNWGRTTAQQSAQDWRDQMTPQEQDELARQWTNLDPHQTIWQGGPSEFIHSVMLQGSQAAPAGIVTMLPMARMLRAGMTNGALAYVGATQTGLSVGQIANNISDDIAKTDDATLQRTSPKFKQLLDQGMDPAQARQQLTTEAQKYAPIIGGLVTGAISTIAGRFLTPVLSKEGASLGARLLGGAADQAVQGGGAAGADYVARETAAHTYDEGRAPDLSGALHATAEGAAQGAIQGGALGVALGHGKRPTQPDLGNINQNPGELHSTMEGTPENKATGAATESHTSMGATDDYEPVERNREGFEGMAGAAATPPRDPHIITPGASGQQEMALPPGVAPDQAMAIQARHESAHWGEAPTGDGYQGAPMGVAGPERQPGYGLQEPNGPQGNLDLRGGGASTPPGMPVPQPAQFNLPLRERGRGGAPQAPLMSPPAEAPQPTRADDLRARANPDWNQPDLLRDNPVPGQLTTRTNRPMVRGNPDTPSAEPFGDIQAQLRDLQDPNHERGGVYLSADNMESLRQRGLLERVRDEAGPNAEPMVNFDEKGGTLIAKSPEHAAQYAQMRDQKAASMEEILGHATGAGTRKPQESNLVVQQHDEHGNVTRETGVNSPEEAEQLQRQYTDVARGRTAVVTSAPAAILRRAQLVGLESEHQNRARSEQGAQRAVSNSLDRNPTVSEALRARALRAARSDTETGRESAPRSREEAASRLTAEARRVHNEAQLRARRGIGVLRPDDLIFANPHAAAEYKRLYGDVLDTHLMAKGAAGTPLQEHAKGGIEPGERQLLAFIKAHKPETRSEQIARSAVEVSREGVKDYLANPEAQKVSPVRHVDTDVLPPQRRPTRSEIHEMSEPELGAHYQEVLNRTASASDKIVRNKLTVSEIMSKDKGDRNMKERRINQYFRDHPGETAGLKAKTRAEVHALSRPEVDGLHRIIVDRIVAEGGEQRSLLTREQMMAEDQDMRSKQERRVNRYYRTQAKREEMGNAKSQGFATSPRKALTTRQEQLNRAKVGRQRRLIGFKTFNPEALMHTIESQREMERAAQMTPEEARADRVEHVKNLGDAIDKGDKSLGDMLTLKREDLAEGASKQLFDDEDAAKAFAEKQNPTAEVTTDKTARGKFRVTVQERGDSPLLAHKYMRELLTYGRSLRAQSLRSPEARSAARKFNSLMETLANKSPVKRAQYLIDTFRTELARQDRAGTVAEPTRGAGQETLPERVTERNEALGETNAKRTAMFSDENPDAFINRMNHDIAVENQRLGIREPITQADLPRNPPFSEAAQTRDTQQQLPFTENRMEYREPRLGEPAAETEAGEAPRQQEYPLGYKSPGQIYALEDDRLRSALGYPQKPTAFRESASSVANLLEQNRGDRVNAHEVISRTLEAFPEGSPMHRLFTALSHAVDADATVGYRGDMPDHIKGQTDFRDATPHVNINRNSLEESRAFGLAPEFELMHTLGHELAHVATARAIEANPFVKQRLEAILAEVRRQPDADLHYGARTNSVQEMVAEAYSNEKFQGFLDTVKMPNVNRSLWTQFKSIVADVLGFKSTDQHFSALDAIMREHGQIFRGKDYAMTPGSRITKSLHLEKDPDGTHVGNGFDRVLKSLRLDRETVSDMAKGGQALLSAMTPRQMRGQFGKYFQKGEDNPYHKYWDTYFKRAADNAVSMEKVGKLSNHWSNLEDKYGNDVAFKVSKLMHDASIYQFHPDLPIDHADNEHLKSPAQIARQAEGEKVFKSLPQEWQDHYSSMKRYYANEQRATTDQIVLNGLHAMLTKGEDASMSPKEFDARYSVEDVRKLGLDTEEGLKKEFPKLDGASVDVLAKMGALKNKPGPYFPLMRNGDFVVSAKRDLGTKTFDDGAAARKYMSEQRAKDPTLTVNLKVDEDGRYNVSTSEKEVRMAESRSEANQHRRDMVAQYGEGNVEPVQLKADLFQSKASITTGSALDRILGALNDNPAAQNAVKDFYLRSLGDQSFRKRELYRQNRRGVAVENQHRSFTQYGRSQSYYLSQLKYGRHLANAQGEVQSAVRAHSDQSEVSSVRLGEIARELSLRDKISQNPYEVSDIARKGSALTQFMMITSPSHWFVRGAQPYVLSAPWLGARHGFADSVAALGRAQAMIANPLVRETANSQLGLKALFSRASAEKSFSVMDEVMNYVKQRGGKDAGAINTMLQHLRDNNLIDLSMATELSDISKGKSTGLTARVMDASRVMLHLIEVNNRVMTAIAARELGLKQGMTEQQAIEHAAEAINVTHNDYSYGNTPRLFMAQSKGVLGGMRPLMFQFMKYPQQVYGMMISSGLAALKGKTPAERAIGIKTLTGVLATHLLAAGAVGATIQPIKWALGLLAAGASALGLTDDPYTVANALSGDTYNHALRGVMNELFGSDIGELASKGLPAYLGTDLSERMALGATYSFHLKTDSDASTLGSLLESVGGPWLNVAENFYDSGKKFLSGDVVGGIQHMSPHIIRDLVKAGAMSQNGVVDNAGRTVIPADQISGPQLAAQALGFRPDEIAEKQNAANAMRNEQQNLMNRKKEILAQYANAEPNDRQHVVRVAQEFSAQHPGFKIDASALLKARAAKMEAEREMQQYGIRAKGNQLRELRSAGDRYNVQR